MERCTAFCLADEFDTLAGKASDEFVQLKPFRVGAEADVRTWRSDETGLVIGWFAAEEASVRRIEALSKVAPASLQPSSDTIFVVGDGKDTARLYRWVAGRVTSLVDEVLADTFRSRRELARMRIELEDTLVRFEEHAHSVGQFLAQNRVLAATFDPVPNTVCALGGQGIAQQLPVRAYGLSTIDIWVEKAPPARAKGKLIAIIKMLQSDKSHTISLAARDMELGWNALNLERALSEDFARTAVHLSWEGDESSAPVLGLANPSPLPEAVAKVGPVDLTAPLALRVWRMAAGSVVPPPVSHVSKSRASASPEPTPARGVLDWKQLSSAELHAPIIPDPKALVWADRRIGVLVVHPPQKGQTVAIVRNVTNRPVQRVAALFHLPNKESAPVEVAIGVASETAEGDGLTNSLGPWTTINPMQWAEAHCESANVSDGSDKQIVIATRMAGGAENHWASVGVARVELF
jgi:hypothetical protein